MDILFGKIALTILVVYFSFFSVVILTNNEKLSNIFCKITPYFGGFLLFIILMFIWIA